MNTQPQQPSRLTSAASATSRTAKVHNMAALVITANAARAEAAYAERLKDGRITSKLVTCVSGKVRVRVVSGLAEYEAKGDSEIDEADALAQAMTSFMAWELEQQVAKGGEAVVLDPSCF